MRQVKRIERILFPISDVEVSSYNEDISDISFYILEIIEGWLMFIRVYIDHKENTTIIKKKETINVSVVKNILFEREAHIWK